MSEQDRVLWHRTGPDEAHGRERCSVGKCGWEALGSWLRPPPDATPEPAGPYTEPETTNG